MTLKKALWAKLNSMLLHYLGSKLIDWFGTYRAFASLTS